MSMGVDTEANTAGCGAPELANLGPWQRLGQLEHSRHVFAVIGEVA